MRLSHRINGRRLLPALVWAFAVSVQIPGIFKLQADAQEVNASAPAEWQIESVKFRNHDKSYLAGKFSLLPAKKHRFVFVSFRVTATRPDPAATDELAAAQKLTADAKQALKKDAQGDQRCFDMAKLALSDSEGGRHPALWNTDNSIATDVVTLAGPSSAAGRDPAHWSKAKRSAATLSKESKERLIKAGTIEANHPDYRTGFSGLLEVDQPVDVEFLFQIPDSVDRDGLAVTYGARGEPARSVTAGLPKSTDGAGNRVGVKPEGEPAWQIEGVDLNPFGASYVKEQVNVIPGEKESLVEVRFKITCLKADPKAAANYARLRGNVDRRQQVNTMTEGVRLFDMRSLALIDRSGRRYPARWIMDDTVRTSIFTAEVTGNSSSTRQSSSGRSAPDSVWIDGERSFTTRTIRYPDGRSISEHTTAFAGIIANGRTAELRFLFSIPTDGDRQGMRLEYDSVVQPVVGRAAASQ